MKLFAVVARTEHLILYGRCRVNHSNHSRHLPTGTQATPCSSYIQCIYIKCAEKSARVYIIYTLEEEYIYIYIDNRYKGQAEIRKRVYIGGKYLAIK